MYTLASSLGKNPTIKIKIDAPLYECCATLRDSSTRTKYECYIFHASKPIAFWCFSTDTIKPIRENANLEEIEIISEVVYPVFRYCQNCTFELGNTCRKLYDFEINNEGEQKIRYHACSEMNTHNDCGAFERREN